MTIRHVVLIGPMGSGKTTIGRLLATELGWSFVDSDLQLLSKAGLTARELTDSLGVEALHALEREAMKDALATPPPAVIAVAASVADSPQSLEELHASGAAVVYLHAEPEVLHQRLQDSRHRRPVTVEELSELTRTRQGLLMGLNPTAVIDTGSSNPSEVVDELVSALV